jgi:putative ABC transport system permease protein
MLESVVQDVRFAVAGWQRSPGFALAAIATLALGIGANTAIFSVVSGVLLRPLPFSDPHRLVQLNETQPRDTKQGGFDGPVVFGDFEQWRMHSKLLEGLASYSDSSRNLQGAREPEQVATVSAERGLFQLLGVTPFAGRTFGDDDPLDVAVVSYGFWQGHFGEAPFTEGRRVVLDGESFTVIGVMPEGFRFPYSSTAIALWLPWEAPADLRAHPNRRLSAVIARLKPGVSLEAARQELAGMEGPARSGRIVRIAQLAEVVSGPVRASLLVLLGAVGMVLLVACVNVANLLLARVASRTKEIAIRSALGAGAFRLLRQFLTESLLLAVVGGAVGLAIGVWGSRLLTKFAGTEIPRADEIGFDWRVFAFLLLTCLATGIGFGLVPAIAAIRGGAGALRSGRIGVMLRDALVVLQIGLAFVLLAGAGLLVRTFLNLQATPPGLAPENVLTLHIVVTGAQETLAIESRVAGLANVRAAGAISLLPLQTSGWAANFTINGRPGLLPTELRYVTPGYFDAIGVPLRRGRAFAATDVAASPLVILVNETLARRYFPNEDPVGRVTNRGTIIGVVGDVRQESLSIPAEPEIYYTMAQNFAQMRQHGSTLVVRGRGPLELLVGQVRAAVRGVSPGQALFRIETMEQVIQSSLAKPRLYVWLLGLFAAMGVVLAAAGIYGVIAYVVTVRMREFGIRIALGADGGRLIRLVLSRGGVLVLLGLAVGIGGAALLTKVLSGVLYGVGATDPFTFASMAALMAAVALAACVVPARRAASVDPAVTLRSE